MTTTKQTKTELLEALEQMKAERDEARAERDRMKGYWVEDSKQALVSIERQAKIIDRLKQENEELRTKVYHLEFEIEEALEIADIERKYADTVFAGGI